MDTNTEIILRGKGSDISVQFDNPISIPTDEYVAKIGLKSFVTFNNIANVIEGSNNSVKVKAAGEKDFAVCRLATGAYEIEQISGEIQQFLKNKYPKLTKIEEAIQIIGNESTQKAEILIGADGYGISFDVENSIHQLLGYKRTDCYKTQGRFIASGIVDIVRVTNLVFNTNISQSNYINNFLTPFVYACSLDVPPGYRIQREVSNISYKRLTTNQITHLRCWVTDQLNRSIDIRGDELIVILSLRLEKLIPEMRIDKND